VLHQCRFFETQCTWVGGFSHYKSSPGLFDERMSILAVTDIESTRDLLAV